MARKPVSMRVGIPVPGGVCVRHTHDGSLDRAGIQCLPAESIEPMCYRMFIQAVPHGAAQRPCGTVIVRLLRPKMFVADRTATIWEWLKGSWSRSYVADTAMGTWMRDNLEARRIEMQGGRTKQCAAWTTPANGRQLDTDLECNAADVHRRQKSRSARGMSERGQRVQRPALKRPIVCGAQSGHQAVVAISCFTVSNTLAWGYGTVATSRVA